MRNRWFHAPVLHTRFSGDKKVSWLELFYDLIFVAAIIQLGDALSSGVQERGLGMFVQFGIHFVPLWVAWTGFTFYANRFNIDDFFHRALVFVKMFAVGAMAIAAPEAMATEARPAKFALAYAVAQGCVALMYVRSYRQVDEGRPYSRYWGTVFAIGAVCWALSAALPAPYCYGLWALGLSAVLFAPISKQSRALVDQLPLDMEHLSERYGLLTIIVLGESFVKVLSYLASGAQPTSPELLIKGGMNLIVTFCIWWVYFDDVGGAQLKKGRGSFVIWLYGHIPLTIGITAVGVSVKKAIGFDLMAVPDTGYRWLLAGSVALTFLAVAIIDSVTMRRHAELSDHWRVNVRIGSAIVVVLLSQVGASMNAGVFLGIVGALCLAQVIFDMMMAPFEEVASSEGAVSVAELTRRHNSRDEDAAQRRSGPVRRDISEAVRKGTPSDLRRDLYFYFIEGSWSRMLLSLTFGYLMLNVVFAGLYLLEPGSFSQESNSFFDAFSFSVQTMSTIGYGALAPQTDYGNFIVTLEAAAGILVTALATGLMFAKASRPRSSVLFSEPMIITTMGGKRVLMFRAGNARGNDVVDASVSFTVLCDELSEEGHHLRRVYDLKLMRTRTPVFTLSWSVMHEIDEDSPLYGIDWDAPDQKIILFTATIMGHDSTYGQTTHARHVYYPENVRIDHRFVDVISQLDDGRLMIDYTHFHETVAEDL